MNIRCVKSKANPDNQKFGISYILLLNPYLFKTDKTLSSLNKLHDLQACSKTIYRLFNEFFLFLITSSDANRSKYTV